jgi:hypothetical protein
MYVEVVTFSLSHILLSWKGTYENCVLGTNVYLGFLYNT